jgi:protein phosphatase
MADPIRDVLTAAMRPGAKYDIVGDVHGCWDELCALMKQCGYRIDEAAIEGHGPINADHPDGRLLVFVGDLTDRGPGSDKVLRLALGMISSGAALCTTGNHDWKLARYLAGNPVATSRGGISQTIEQIAPLPSVLLDRVRTMLLSLPHQVRLPMPEDHLRYGDGYLTVVHAAAPAHHIDQETSSAFSRAVYGYPDGFRDDGTVIRLDWAKDYAGPRWIVHGHEPHREVRQANRVINIDTGCAFGGAMTMYRADTCELVQVPAVANHSGQSGRLH